MFSSGLLGGLKSAFESDVTVLRRATFEWKRRSGVLAKVLKNFQLKWLQPAVDVWKEKAGTGGLTAAAFRYRWTIFRKYCLDVWCRHRERDVLARIQPLAYSEGESNARRFGGWCSCGD